MLPRASTAGEANAARFSTVQFVRAARIVENLVRALPPMPVRAGSPVTVTDNGAPSRRGTGPTGASRMPAPARRRC